MFMLLIFLLLAGACARAKAVPIDACRGEKESLGLQVYLLQDQVKSLEDQLVVARAGARVEKKERKRVRRPAGRPLAKAMNTGSPCE